MGAYGSPYGSFKYGVGGSVYGTGDPNEYMVWSFLVYWDDAFVDEVSRMQDLQVDRGRDHLLSTSGGWERFRPGELSALFDNSDGRYDPFNTGSPLYGFILPGRVVRVAVTVTPSGSSEPATYQIMRGIITDIRSILRGGQRQARITVKDGLEWLSRRTFTYPLTLNEEALDTAAAIAALAEFDTVDDWSIAILGTDSEVLGFYTPETNKPLDEIQTLADLDAGQVIHLADGRLALVTGDYTHAVTTEIDEDKLLRDIEIKQPWEVIRNRAQIEVYPVAYGTPTVLYEYGTNFSYGSPYEEIPIGSTTITHDAIYTGSTDPGLTVEIFAYYLKGPGPIYWSATQYTSVSYVPIAGGIRITLTRSGYVDSYAVRIGWIRVSEGEEPIIYSDQVSVISEDSTSIGIYGEKTFALDLPPMQDSAYAQAYTDYILEELGPAHIFPTIQIEGRGALQFSQELFINKVDLTIPTMGIDAIFRVGKISHKWLNENGFAVRTILKLEPVLTPWDGVV